MYEGPTTSRIIESPRATTSRSTGGVDGARRPKDRAMALPDEAIKLPLPARSELGSTELVACVPDDCARPTSDDRSTARAIDCGVGTGAVDGSLDRAPDAVICEAVIRSDRP